MEITKLGSATITVKTKDVKILCDPWLTDGAYYGSWCNFPPINLNDCNFDDIDYVYISHIHPDHFDPKTMDLVDRSTPILIHRYHQKFLKFNIERLGFNVIELENGTPMSLSNSTKLSIYAADDCDPSVCGHMFGCINAEIKGSMQLDSLCVIDDGKHILVNTNDCPFGIAKNTLKRIKNTFPKIDFALVGYTSASLFPHCMIDYSDKQIIEGIQLAKRNGLQTGLDTLKVLQPSFYMPFAGTYIIGGSEYKKNKNLPQPEIQDAVNFLQAKLCNENIDLKPVLLNYNEHFDLETKKQSAEYIPVDPDERDKYISEEASKFIYDFEKDTPPDSEELMSLFESSLVRFKRKQAELNFYEDMYLLFDLPCKNFASVNLLDSSLSIIEDFEEKSKYHRFQLDPRLLKRVLMGPRFANWNNIEIGALLNFSRRPDVYRMDVHTLINALHI